MGRTQLESDTDSLTCQPTHDALTGLPTRALLEDRLKQAISSLMQIDTAG
ncbi:GGDEF domain-containing protein [Variovorax paradoxus]|nr:GGDEF domain-containing protein [Variovorax paradoxus]